MWWAKTVKRERGFMLAKQLYTCPFNGYVVLVFRDSGSSISDILRNDRSIEIATDQGIKMQVSDTLVIRMQCVYDLVHLMDTMHSSKMNHGAIHPDNMFCNLRMLTFAMGCQFSDKNHYGSPRKIYHHMHPYYLNDGIKPRYPYLRADQRSAGFFIAQLYIGNQTMIEDCYFPIKNQSAMMLQILDLYPGVFSDNKRDLLMRIVSKDKDPAVANDCLKIFAAMACGTMNISPPTFKNWTRGKNWRWEDDYAKSQKSQNRSWNIGGRMYIGGTIDPQRIKLKATEAQALENPQEESE
jgi:hypothetical protein